MPIYVGRIFGTTRYSTAVALSQVYDPGVGTVFVATGDNFPDALAAAARAGSIDAPVLLTRDDSAPYSTLRELDRLNPGQVVVLGGDGAIEDDVVGDIADAAGAPTRRIAGTGRWETAALLAAEFGEVDVAYVATGQTFPDALAASARAGSEGAPVLLVKSDGVPTATADALTELGVSEIVLVGGEGAVDETVEETLESYASVNRVSGRNRYGTAAALSADIAESDTAYVASGQNWPDALAGSARAASEDTPLLLVEPTAVPLETWDALEALGPWDVEVLGGDGAIEDTVLTELRTLE
ncbi:cell wall-binding repeat-containing protein [Serinicoccus chungangensis]|uniref:cell wall-binding repeat-containing protein n=1 Tax=Serinicoccus chungangensis TaxID=767452 RepID=UPI001F2DCFA9